MAKAIEETLKKCKKCNRTTKHYRNTEKTGLLMFLVHLVLTVATMGVWLALVIIYMVLNTKIGGWKCSECST